MTLVDANVLLCANVLLYAYDSEGPRQAPARQWLAAELSSVRPVRLALITLLAFVRIAAASSRMPTGARLCASPSAR